MKNIFNLVAVFVNAYAAAVKSASTVLYNEGGVVVGVMKDFREGFTSSNLPEAIKNAKATDAAADDNVPAWSKDADAEVKLLIETFGPYFPKSEEEEEGEDEETN